MRRGFTLVELMLSLFIMFGSAVVVVQGWERYRAVAETRGAVAEVDALLRRALAEARGPGRPYMLRIASAGVQRLRGYRRVLSSDRSRASFELDREVALPRRVTEVSFGRGAGSEVVVDAGGPLAPLLVVLTVADRATRVQWVLVASPDGTIVASRGTRP